MTIMNTIIPSGDRWSARKRLHGEPSLFRLMSAAERHAARQLAFEAAVAVVG